ncbi:MAG: imidazole glycerol phosphate synthase subunit HisH [Hyphomicrobiaceae bacterium]|nr:imidazole glycerol phosphate synthase subunit HisH [Hyphomicrobiaceae bacterium]
MQRTAIIDYGSGNLHSAGKAVERAARDAGLNVSVDVTSDPAAVRTADRIILPGVGAYGDCKSGLANIDGMLEAIDAAVIGTARPFLGICVGMQLMATSGLEFGRTDGFGWIPGEVGAIAPEDPALKIPHMGWNTLDVLRPHALLAGIPTGGDGQHAYFVHSYHLVPDNPEHVVATTRYGCDVTAIVARDNLAGTQFHPEKSQTLGLRLLANFLRWTP